MDELDELRQKRLQEIMAAQQQEEMQEQAQLQHQVHQLEAMVKAVMTKEAMERYGNIKAAHPERAVQVMVVLAQLLQAGQLKSVDDSTMKQVLARLQPEKKEFKITRN